MGKRATEILKRRAELRKPLFDEWHALAEKLNQTTNEDEKQSIREAMQVVVDKLNNQKLPQYR